MPKTFSLEIRTPAGIVMPIHGEFTDEEWGRIQDFSRYARELGELPLVREDGRWPELNLKIGTPNEPAKIKKVAKGDKLSLELEGAAPIAVDASRLPPKAEIDALLHRMRPFIFNQKADDRRTNFLSVLNIIARRIPCPILWNPLKDRFLGRRTAKMMQLRVTDKGKTRELISDESVHDWLDAFEYHRNAKKAARFNEIPSDHVTRDAIRALMLELLRDKATAIIRVGIALDGLDKPRRQVRILS